MGRPQAAVANDYVGNLNAKLVTRQNSNLWKQTGYTVILILASVGHFAGIRARLRCECRYKCRCRCRCRCFAGDDPRVGACDDHRNFTLGGAF